MEKICSVCAAPMIRTENGYKCSFCAHSESFGESDLRESSSKWTTYTSYTETEEKEREIPLSDLWEKTFGKENTEPELKHDDVMVEVPMGNAPQGVELPERDALSDLTKTITKNQPKWKKIVKIYVIIMVAQMVIPLLFFLISGLAGSKVIDEKDDFKITIDKSTFPVIEVPEVPEVDFEMPEIEVIMPDIEWPDFSYLEDSNMYSSVTMQAVLPEIFGKPIEEITREDLQSIQYFMVEADEEMGTMEVKYSTEDYSLYPVEYSEEESADNITFGYNIEFAETIHTISVPFENDWTQFYTDMEKFENLKAMNICQMGFADLSQFPKVTMLDAEANSLNSLAIMKIPTDQIEVLRLNTTFLDGLEQLTGLKSLYIDGNGQIVTDLSVLENMPWLEELTIKDTYIGNLNFLKGIPELRSLRLINNKLITDKSGLDSLVNLENLMIE